MQIVINEMKDKKRLAICQILLLVVGMFAFAYAFNDIGFVSATLRIDAGGVVVPGSLPLPGLRAVWNFATESNIVKGFVWTIGVGTVVLLWKGVIGNPGDWDEAFFWAKAYGGSVGAAFSGNIATNWFIKEFLTKFIPEIAVGAAWIPGVGLIVGGISALITFYRLSRRENTRAVGFSCDVWQPAKGGKDCDLCNKNEFECTEYQCKSLGGGCELANKDTDEPRCYWNNDKTAPKISAWEDALMKDYSYSELDSGLGVEVEYDGGCVPAADHFTFGVALDKVGTCKINDHRTDDFSKMESLYLGGENIAKENHTHLMMLPVSAQGGNYEYYVRCENPNGYSTDREFVFKFCVEDGPDNNIPEILGFDLPDNTPIKWFDGTTAHEISIEAYVDESASCKWSQNDVTYESMENDLICSIIEANINAQLSYTCSGTLTGLENSKENKFYFRCQDNVGNVMPESKEFTLIGTQPLVIDSVAPVDETIRGSTESVQVPLGARTSAGYKDGEARCYYSATGNYDDYIIFENTESYVHSHDLPLGAGEDYEYYIQCIDMAGNVDIETISFEVETDFEAPLVIRAYYEGGDLNLITNELAECVYSTDSCSYNFIDGVSIISSDDILHSVTWNTNNNLYVKCRDEYGNQPNNGCSISVRPFEFF